MAPGFFYSTRKHVDRHRIGLDIVVFGYLSGWCHKLIDFGVMYGNGCNRNGYYYNGGRTKAVCFMRHERFISMDYRNQQLMDELNDYCIALKIWLYPERFGDRLQDLQRRYPKPDLSEIDNFQNRLNEALRKDAVPLIKY